ncbi:MAG TPA: type II toxin-antitoxin system death-on-curing family toxin [Acidobacteriota bacterium]|nr:type II toxin-antitoxin system death-on-curing family toxin [Acidobacteriota bacterium]
MRHLTIREVQYLHHQLIDQTGGAHGIRDLAGLESAIAQPHMTFGGKDLYPTLEEKAAALAFSLIKNHPFLDGNKRIGHAAMETFLVLNGYELMGSVDDSEKMILAIAAGEKERAEVVSWVRSRLVEHSSGS